MNRSQNNRYFVRLSMWNNMVQDYLPVGTLIYEKDDRLGFVGFAYDSDYVNSRCPAIDPAHLDPKVNSGRYVCRAKKGTVPHYFSAFLPGEFGQQLLSGMSDNWRKLNEAEKLYIMTLAHGDFGAPQLNPQNDQYNNPIKDLEELSLLVATIRNFQNGAGPAPIPKELHGAVCSFRGPKPKIDFESEKDGISRRFVVKINTTGYYNDARVSKTMNDLEISAGISICNSTVVKLNCGEEVLFSYNYARTEKYQQQPDGSPTKLILKYNRISFKTLLADDPILGNTQKPSLRHAIHVIDKYSADPVSDKEELFRRTIFSASTNHTSNGLDNLEMYDKGDGTWRLSPSYHNLPNPLADTCFDLSFYDTEVSSNLLRVNEEFLNHLANAFDFDETYTKLLALPVVNSLLTFDRAVARHSLSDNDKLLITRCIKINDLSALRTHITQDKRINASMLSEIHVEEIDQNDKLFTQHQSNKSTPGGPQM